MNARWYIVLWWFLLAGTLPGATMHGPDKEATARAVFDRLVDAWGESSRPAPYFTLTAARRSGARVEGNLIVLEEAAYDLCMSFGAEADYALATVLAHELIHYYAGHARGGSGIGLLADPGPDDREAEADYRGGFLAYLAGYPTSNVMPRVLEGLYNAYGLPDTLTDYPTLNERKALADRTYRELQELIEVFEMAVALTALDRYGEAAPYYDHLLQSFPSREIYNNAGVVYARAALPLFQPTTLRYVYPIELDLRTRLDGQTRSLTTDRATREAYLHTARRYFERARLLDPAYAPAVLNLGSTHALLAASLLESDPDSLQRELAADRQLEATLRAREAARMGNPTTADHARVLLGILAAERRDSLAAEALLAGENPLAVENRTVLRTGHVPPRTAARQAERFIIPETVGGQGLADMRLAPEIEGSARRIENGSYPLRLVRRQPPAETVSVLHHSAADGEEELLLAWVQPGYVGTTALEIGCGQPRSRVIEEYGSPGYSIATAGGEVLVYTDHQLAFCLRNGAVASWFLYAER
ncbi:M48 family metalloprotease [Neolewinella litorea]|uniref:Peptidase M48 domain-containing protein n=1 Tax=Neolewinella litorea TaxID=2562452 RepID=A0A4S4NLL3_9BACT|nr:hypothetical protein [Neolewinella litorea]THH39777.1 hypothetical protein E4021_09185 [Neolewinella litorea]